MTTPSDSSGQAFADALKRILRVPRHELEAEEAKHQEKMRAHRETKKPKEA